MDKNIDYKRTTAAVGTTTAAAGTTTTAAGTTTTAAAAGTKTTTAAAALAVVTSTTNSTITELATATDLRALLPDNGADGIERRRGEAHGQDGGRRARQPQLHLKTTLPLTQLMRIEEKGEVRHGHGRGHPGHHLPGRLAGVEGVAGGVAHVEDEAGGVVGGDDGVARDDAVLDPDRAGEDAHQEWAGPLVPHAAVAHEPAACLNTRQRLKAT